MVLDVVDDVGGGSAGAEHLPDPHLFERGDVVFGDDAAGEDQTIIDAPILHLA